MTRTQYCPFLAQEPTISKETEKSSKSSEQTNQGITMDYWIVKYPANLDPKPLLHRATKFNEKYSTFPPAKQAKLRTTHGRVVEPDDIDDDSDIEVFMTGLMNEVPYHVHKPWKDSNTLLVFPAKEMPIKETDPVSLP